MKQLRDYQSKVITDIKSDINSGKPLIVMAMCPNSGKTFTSIKLMEDLLDSGKASKVLVLAHATTVLRSQFYESIIEQEPSFTYKQITPQSKGTNAQVLVALPQGIDNIDFSDVDAVIIDEAHEYYLAPSVQKLLKQINPKFQVLLTGTPSKFIWENHKKPDTYSIHMVAMSDIPAEHMANAQVFVCASKYDIKEEDYNETEDINGAYKFKKKDTEGTIELFLEHMHKVLKTKSLSSLDNYVQLSFSSLKKTMFACKSQQQAKQVYEYLNKKGVQAVVSTEDTDAKSENVAKFVKDKKITVLVVVNRGILGFNLPTLVNVVDMSGTRNLDRMYQLFSRVTRTHEDVKIKRYFKVAPATEVEYTQYVTSAMLSLIHRDNISIYNGKNFKTDIPVMVKRKERKSKGKSKSKGKGKTNQTLYEFEGIDVINVFTKLYSNLDEELQVYSKTNLGEVRKLIGASIQLPSGYWTLERCKESAFKYSSRGEWRKRCNSSYLIAGINGWSEECCEHMPPKPLKTQWTLEKCKNSALLNKSRKEWEKTDPHAYSAAHKRGWHEECCEHMPKSIDSIKTENLKLKYLSHIKEFKEKPRRRNNRNLYNKGRHYMNPKYSQFDPKFKAEVEALCKELGI